MRKLDDVVRVYEELVEAFLRRKSEKMEENEEWHGMMQTRHREFECLR